MGMHKYCIVLADVDSPMALLQVQTGTAAVPGPPHTELHTNSCESHRDSLLAGDGDPNRVGKHVVLPVTYTSGHTCMRQSDIMAAVLWCG